MNPVIKDCFVFLFGLSIFSVSDVTAQDEISDLSLDELAHVNIEKNTIGLLEHKPYNVNDIYLGLIVPYSIQKEYSIDLKNAVDLAIDEINSSGGVLNKKLQVVAADDGAFKELSVLYADSLINHYKISALIGPTGSSRLLHLGKTYLPQHPVLVISPSASSEEISQLVDDDLIWRTMPSDAQQTKFATAFIFNRLKKKSVGIIYSQDVYGKGLCREFKERFKGEILSEIVFSPLVNLETFDFTEKLDDLFKNKPEVIYLAMGGHAAAALSHKISKGKYISPAYTPVFFGVDATIAKDFTGRGDRKITEGMYGTALSRGNADEFRNRFFKKFNKHATTPDAERAYDIVYILALAIEKANSANYVRIRNEIRNVTGDGEKIGPGDFSIAKEKLKARKDVCFEGASGKIKFDERGDITSGIFEIWKIVKGKFTTYEVLPSEELR
jgi:ABC-type branched-subunit amino acid transport system substrate-binding protein